MKPIKPLLALTVSIAVFLTACPPDPDHPTPPPPSDSTYCEPAGKVLTDNHCVEAVAPDGRSFAVVCREDQDNGIDFHPKCIAELTPDQLGDKCQNLDKFCTWGK